MIRIRSFKTMPTRPCRYCLALQDDSVFADFDVDPDCCLYLVRISFDGYGCCNPNPKIVMGRIKYKESIKLIEQIEKNTFDTSVASNILHEYFRINKAFLWEDALIDYELIG